MKTKISRKRINNRWKYLEISKSFSKDSNYCFCNLNSSKLIDLFLSLLL